MSAEVTLIDLDIAAPPDRRVKLGGKVWKVPGDPPTGWLLAFRSLTAKFADDNVDELDVVAQLRDAIVDLFLLRQDDEEAICAAVDTLGVPALVQVVNAIYSDAREPEAPARPPRAAGTRSTSPSRKTSGSASSSSSAS